MWLQKIRISILMFFETNAWLGIFRQKNRKEKNQFINRSFILLFCVAHEDKTSHISQNAEQNSLCLISHKGLGVTEFRKREVEVSIPAVSLTLYFFQNLVYTFWCLDSKKRFSRKNKFLIRNVFQKFETKFFNIPKKPQKTTLHICWKFQLYTKLAEALFQFLLINFFLAS